MSLNRKQKKIIEQRATEIVNQNYRQECFFNFQKSYLDTHISEYKKMCTDYNSQVNNFFEETSNDFNALTDNCIINHTDVSGSNYKKDLMDVIELAIDKKTVLMSLNSKYDEIVNLTNQIHSRIKFFSKDQLKKEVQLIANDYNLIYQFAVSDARKKLKGIGIFGILLSILGIVFTLFDILKMIPILPTMVLYFIVHILFLRRSSAPAEKLKITHKVLENKKSEIIQFVVRINVYINACKDIEENIPIVEDFKNWLNHHQQVTDTSLANAMIDKYLYFILPKFRNIMYLQHAKEALLCGYENVKELNEHLENKYHRDQLLEIENERRINESIYHNEMLELVKKGQKRNEEIQEALLEEAKSQSIAAQNAASAAQENAKITKEYEKKSLANQKKQIESAKKTADYVERDYYNK